MRAIMRVIIGRQTLWTLCNRNAHYYYPSTSLAGFLARAPRQRFQVPLCGAKGPVAVLSTSLWVKSSQVPTLHRKILSDLEIDLKTAETPSLMELLLG